MLILRSATGSRTTTSTSIRLSGLEDETELTVHGRAVLRTQDPPSAPVQAKLRLWQRGGRSRDGTEFAAAERPLLGLRALINIPTSRRTPHEDEAQHSGQQAHFCPRNAHNHRTCHVRAPESTLGRLAFCLTTSDLCVPVLA